MSIAEIAQLIVPMASAAAILISTIGSRGDINRRLKTIERLQQMLIMHDEHLPYSERLNAGKRCIDLGGNGSVSAYYKKLEEKYKERVERHMEDD